MTTPTIRQALLTEVNRLAGTVPVFDMSDYHSIDDLPSNITDECLLVDFISSSDRMTTIGGSGNQGWEEDGAVALHWLAPTGFLSTPILNKCEAFRLALRGRRLGKVVVESVEPFADAGSPVDIDGPWTGYSSLMFYTHNSCG